MAQVKTKEHVSGLHEIHGLQSLRVARPKTDRGKLTAKLARLDHQRALLERQLRVWTAKQQATKYRLDLLDTEINQIERLIRELEGPYRTIDRRKPTQVTRLGRQPDTGAASVRDSDVSLEY